MFIRFHRFPLLFNFWLCTIWESFLATTLLGPALFNLTIKSKIFCDEKTGLLLLNNEYLIERYQTEHISEYFD